MRTLSPLLASLAFCSSAAACGASPARETLGNPKGGLVQPAHLHVGAGLSNPSTTLRASLEEGALLRGSPGEVEVGIWIAPPVRPGRQARPPIDVSLVIDRSGSMEGNAMTQAREAAAAFIERLREGDVVSIYAFDDHVVEVVAPTEMGPAVRERALHAVRSLQAGGSTNLHGGLAAGLQAVSRASSSHPVRRVFVLSDGRANVGPSTPEELGQLAARASDLHAQVTAIGLGLEYDERTLGAIAMRSAGRFHHVADARELSAALESELSTLNETVAWATLVEIRPADGVEVIGCEGHDVRHHGGRSVIQLGSLTAGTAQRLLVRMRADTDLAGDRPFAAVRFSWRSSNGGGEEHAAVALRYRVTEDAREVERSRSAEVASLSMELAGAQVERQAVAMLSAGDSDGAARVLEQQAAQARSAASGMSAPAAAPVQRQAAEMERRARRARAATDRASQRDEALQMEDSALDTMGF